MTYSRGDVVRSIDPFKLGDDAERYWLISNDDGKRAEASPFMAESER